MNHPKTTRPGLASDLWPLVHAERVALARDLADLADDDWDTPSLCAGLTVRDVLAHITAAASLTPMRWLAGVIRCRFDFDEQVAMRLKEYLGVNSAATLARFRDAATSTVKPPLPVIGMLGETIVHAEDIRRPLGIRHEHPVEPFTWVAQYYAGSNYLMPTRKHTKGLRLKATDGPLDIGTGPLISGTTVALTMAITGRTVYYGELDGDGVAILRDRQRTA